MLIIVTEFGSGKYKMNNFDDIIGGNCKQAI